MGEKLTSFLALLVLTVLCNSCILATVRDPERAGPQGSKEPVITGSVGQVLLARYLLNTNQYTCFLFPGTGSMHLFRLVLAPSMLAGLGS